MRNSILFTFLIAILFSSCTFDKWSPEDSSILFSSNRSGNSEIYIKHPDDTTWINLTNNSAGDNWPVWSPDGSKIVFQSTRTGKYAVWIMNRDGSGQKRLTIRPDNDYLPSFTPDGSQITFTSWRIEAKDEKRAPRIYIMNPDGTGQRRLVEKSPRTSTGASWHPSGQRFVYAGKVSENAAEIMEADRNGNFLNQLTRDNLSSGSAEYSPDGSRIAFHQDDGTVSSIVVINADGSNRSVIVSEGSNYYPHWSPDGNWITFTKQSRDSEKKDYDIYAVSLKDVDEIVKIIDSTSRDTEGRWEPEKIL